MKERPILFSGAMVRALLAGTKTQTRRVVKPPPPADKQRSAWYEPGIMGWAPPEIPSQHWHRVRCPYGQPGDRLWVRETHAPQPDCSLAWDNWMKGFGGEKPIIHYAADESERAWVDKWRPSIHMPRWASRITLEVTGVRVERLQDISEADALAEGIAQVVHDKLPVQQCGEYDGIDVDPVDLYRDLWESINGPGSWEANPWVWVVAFKRVEAAA